MSIRKVRTGDAFEAFVTARDAFPDSTWSTDLIIGKETINFGPNNKLFVRDDTLRSATRISRKPLEKGDKVQLGGGTGDSSGRVMGAEDGWVAVRWDYGRPTIELLSDIEPAS